MHGGRHSKALVGATNSEVQLEYRGAAVKCLQGCSLQESPSAGWSFYATFCSVFPWENRKAVRLGGPSVRWGMKDV